jgi:2-oxoglutarate dehydrogenase dihydrolipoamide succinyltransferase (E2 component)
MLVEVVMPKMGESLQEGTIIRWLKNPGDKVERDEMILEISTDKVDTEVPSPVSGTLAEIFAQANETVPVGQKIANIETEANPQVPAPKAKEQIETEATQNVTVAPLAPVQSVPDSNEELVDVVMPKMGESLQEGTIIRWLKNLGDKVERDEMILEISTDKVDTEVPSPVSGVLAQVLAQANETVEVGKVIAKISTGSPPAIVVSATNINKTTTAISTLQPVIESINATMEIPRKFDEKFFSPLVRSIAEQEKVSLEELMTIKGSGLEGRINKEDILNYVNNRKQAPAIQQHAITKAPETMPVVMPNATIATQAISSPTVYGADSEIIPMDRMRQLISQHMVLSTHTSPHVTSVGEADLTEIVKFRNKYKNEFEKREGFKLTFTPFFAKATVEAIKDFPMINVSVDGTNIIRHKRINLSFATALPDGNLIVPVIKNADNLNITGLARSVYDLSMRARTKKLNPDDIQGGTFTITNFGTFGTLFGTPIINQPQVAIMGIGAINKRAIVKEFNGEPVIVIRDMAYISITYDHRVVDGMLGGQWLEAVIKHLESMNENTIVL